MSWIRLRQVALVARSLDPVVSELSSSLGLRVAYRDPAVAMFGVHNAVLPAGSQFVEVVSPLPGNEAEGTAAGRYLERIGGDGGYMVICHSDDPEAVRDRASAAGVRVAFEADDHGYRIMQQHPRDTGGSFLEVDYQPGGSEPWGPWTPAGPEWQSAVCTDVIDGLAGVTVSSADPARTASVWSTLLGRPLRDGSILDLDNATISFEPGVVDSLSGVTVSGPPPGSAWLIGGVRFSTGPA